MQAEERLGPYKMLQRIGRGGMAEIWSADRGDGRPLALKVLPLNVETSPTALRRFVDEGQLTLKLTHPNIVQVLDIGVDHERAYIGMELLEGLPVSRLLGKRHPPEMVLAIARQVLRGLAHAHAEPFHTVHRDVKPSNVFVTTSGRVKLIDFGIAFAPMLDTTQTRTGHFRGSVAYSSPEQVRGEKVDARTDLFSLALVLRELLTGRRVFDQHSEAEVIGKLLFSPIEPLRQLLPDAPPELAQVFDWPLEKDREKRPPSAQAWSEALTTASSDLQLWSEEQLGEEVRATKALQRGLSTGTVNFNVSVELPPHASTSDGSSAPPVAARSDAASTSAARKDEASLPIAARKEAESQPMVAADPPKPRQWRVFALALLAVASVVGGWIFLRRPPSSAMNVAHPSATATPAPSQPEEPARASPDSETAAAPSRVIDPAKPLAQREEEVAASPALPKKAAASRARPKKAASAPTGWLTVEAKPEWARISIDGKDVGPSPVYRHRIPAGRIVVEGVRADGSRRKRAVVVAADHESIVVLQW